MLSRALACHALLLVPAAATAADVIQPGKLELYPTPAAVSVELPFQGDDNGNATASFVWKRRDEAKWRNGVDMTIDRKRGYVWASVWPLEPGETVEVKVSVRDPDAPNLEDVSASVTTRRLILEPEGGKQYYVSPSGDDANPGTKERPFRTLAHAGKQAGPGDIVYALSGVYAEGDLFKGVRGTAEKPIVFAAAEGHKPVLDSSAVIDKGSEGWKEAGDGVYVIKADFSGGYVAQDGRRMFRYGSFAELRADTDKVRRAWYYDRANKLLFVRTGTGSPASAHAYNLSRHDYALHLSGSKHVVVSGFTMRFYGAACVRLSEGAEGCVIIDNVLHNAPVGVFMKSVTTRDNVVWRNHIYEAGLEDFTWGAIKDSEDGRQGVYCDRCGRGNSFCHNRIHGFFDGIAVESWKNPEKLEFNRDCDMMFNQIWNAGDDAIEADGGGVNLRIHGNRIRNCRTAISLAPVERGPVYVTRNDATFLDIFIKFNVSGCTSLGWTYCYHNSGYCLLAGDDGGTGFSFPPGIPCANKVLKNNVVMVNEWCVRAGKPGYLLDHNCYCAVPGRPPRRFQWDRKVYGTIDQFRRATGQERGGWYADPGFRSSPDAGKYPSPDDPEQDRLGRYPLLPDTKTGDLRLRPRSQCIDRGAVLRGINEDYRGAAPDIGAFEADEG